MDFFCLVQLQCQLKYSSSKEDPIAQSTAEGVPAMTFRRSSKYPVIGVRYALIEVFHIPLTFTVHIFIRFWGLLISYVLSTFADFMSGVAYRFRAPSFLMPVEIPGFLDR